MPKVSVIIPCYNHGQYLDEAVDSVLAQTFQDFEIIIVNDGSTDNTRDVANELIKSDPRITYYFQENQGLSASRNKGFALAKGEFIQFLDADDLITENKFELQLECFRNNPLIDVCYTNYQVFDSQTGERKGRTSPAFSSDFPLNEFIFRWERGFSIPIHCSLFRKSVFSQTPFCGVPFNESLTAKEDWVMWVGLASKNIKFHFLDIDCALYRSHSNNMCKDNHKMGVAFLKALAYIDNFLNDSNRDDFYIESFNHLCDVYSKQRDYYIELQDMKFQLESLQNRLNYINKSKTYRFLTFIKDVLLFIGILQLFEKIKGAISLINKIFQK